MQLAYQFPERCERLVLVDSGGLGREVSGLLRVAGLPGSELVLPLLVNGRVLGPGRGVGRLLDRLAAAAHRRRGGATRACLAFRRGGPCRVHSHA
jgi:pimeloyl-ACP methyl ester carboxylesterase